jgi:aminoacyl tRNA synthase complex-interacting multifunctional protein 1
MIQPGFTTTADLDVAFDAGVVKELSKDGEEPKTGLGKLVTASGGACKVKSLSGGIVR